MRISLRRASPTDATSLAAVEVTTWQRAFCDLMPVAFLNALSVEDQAVRWARSLVKHGHGGQKRTLVAVLDDEVVGYVTVGRDPGEEEMGFVYLLYVLPEHWGCGVGGALMTAAMDELRDLALPEAVLWVLRENGRARRFYERLGWHADGRTRTDDYGGVELDAVCYRRAVAG
jgi:GNAT superfamily N-acetyltransferase